MAAASLTMIDKIRVAFLDDNSTGIPQSNAMFTQVMNECWQSCQSWCWMTVLSFSASKVLSAVTNLPASWLQNGDIKREI